MALDRLSQQSSTTPTIRDRNPSRQTFPMISLRRRPSSISARFMRILTAANQALRSWETAVISCAGANGF
jgi:hypothetical protein